MNQPAGRKHIGEILLAAGVIDATKLEDALRYQRETGLKLGQCLLRLGHCREEDVVRALARQSGIPFVDVTKGTIAPEAIAAVPREVAEANNILPVKLEGPRKLILAVSDPLAIYNLEHLSFTLNIEFRCALTTETALLDSLRRYYGIDKREVLTISEQAVKAAKVAGDDEGPIIRLVQNLFEDAAKARASDIHVEPMADRVRVRFRVDGVLKVAADLPKTVQGAVLSRLKLMAGMDIAEKRKPQDGRASAETVRKQLDVRVSALPGTHGESIVMRLLDKQEGLVSLERLGFDARDHERFRRVIRRPNGIMLVTGPTGSGKTTTLYAALQELNRPDVKIITAENPIEYHIPGINQCQVHHQIGLDFARILRAMLRQAPNIILVGEIRDRETATIAIQAALTGHLVFSTLHTNDASSALTRLVDMGVAPFLVSSSVAAVMAQRLLRKLCNRCKQEHDPDPGMLAGIGLSRERLGGKKFWRATGCADCRNTGYSGRVGIFEMLEMSTDLREAVFQGASTAKLRDHARTSGGMLPLREDAIRKVLAGVTSGDEVLRVLSKETVGAAAGTE